MTTPAHATPNWDDEKDVERAMQSLDDLDATIVEDMAPLPDTIRAPERTMRAPERTVVTQDAPAPVVMTSTVEVTPSETHVKPGGERVLRRKPTQRRTAQGEGRTLRRKPKQQAPRQQVPRQPVASQPYDEGAYVGSVTSSWEASPAQRSSASGPILVVVLALRLLAIAICALVVLMAIPSLGDRASLVQISTFVSSFVPSAMSGVLVLPTPFGGAFRGDFVLAALALYIVDWSLTNLRARLVRGRRA